VQEADHGILGQRAQVGRVGPDVLGPEAAAAPGAAMSIVRTAGDAPGALVRLDDLGLRRV